MKSKKPCRDEKPCKVFLFWGRMIVNVYHKIQKGFAKTLDVVLETRYDCKRYNYIMREKQHEFNYSCGRDRF